MKALTSIVVLVGMLAVASPSLAAAKVSGLVNLNTASAAQLDALPGVGEKAAARIVTYRQKTPFKRVEELVKVKGFGKKKFDKLKPHLSINGPTTLQVESAAQGRRPPGGH